MANEIEVSVKLDEKSLRKALDKFEGKAEKSGVEAGESLGKGISTGVKAAVAGLGAIIAGALAARIVIREAIKTQDAINNLNASLKTAGTFSIETSKSFQELARTMEETTTFSANATLEMAGLAQAFVTTAEEAEELTRVAIDFSIGAGISFEEAIRRLGRGVQGAAGDIANFAPAIRNLTRDQLAAGEATRILGERFRNAALEQATTFSSRIIILSNSFDSLLSSIGELIINNPLVLAAIEELTKFINDLTKNVSELDSVFGEIIRGSLSLFFDALIFGSKISAAFNLVAGNIAISISRLDNVLVSAKLSIIDFINEINKGLGSPQTALSQQALDEQQDIVDASRATTRNLIDIQNERIAASEESRRRIAEIQQRILDSTRQDVDENRKATEEAKNDLLSLGDSFGLIFDSFTEATEGAKEAAIKNFAAIGKAMRTTLAGTAGSAFAAFGKAIAKGENAIDAFLNSLLASFGQMAIQLGTQFILQGIAFSFAGIASGPSLVAAGAALAAFGGILSALGPSSTGTSGGDTGGGVAAAGGGGGIGDVSLEAPELAETVERGPEITLVIQGDVLDRRETGLALVEILNEALDTNDVRLASATA